MKVVVDDKIPYIKEAIESIADEVVFVPGKDFTADLVKDADALIVRTRTNCNRELLEGSKVRFIATATIGYDHIDREYCREAGIEWRNAPGCNADSVAQYVNSSLLFLAKENGVKLEELTLGIVGVGNVGSRVAEVGRRLGMTVLENDPPREKLEGVKMDSLGRIARDADIISFHTPLVSEGEYKTYHLADHNFFASLQRKPIIINTSRGEVINTEDLKAAIANNKIQGAILDVWEHEPNIDRELMNDVLISTPHIAGYSADGKANATRMSLDSLCRYFNIKAAYNIEPPKPNKLIDETMTWEEQCLSIYNPQEDSDRLRANPESFEQLRGDYPLRRENKAYNIE